VGLANLGSESDTCVGSRVRLVGVFISFEKNFYRLPFTPHLSGSPYRSFTFEFSFEAGCHDARSIEIFNIFIHPCALPAEFCEGRLNHSTYEYYQPNMMDQQLGCGQMPPRLFLHEFLKPREEIKDSIQARRVFEYECIPTLYTWLFTPTTIAHPLFISWWQEFYDHIFSKPVHSFFLELMLDFQPTSEVTHLSVSL
jgi:hypothetical protein